MLSWSAGTEQEDKLAAALLWSAADLGNVEQIKEELAKGTPVDARGSTEWTSLHRACDRGRYEAVCALLDAGANHALQTKQGGDTPMHLAAAKGYNKIVRALIDAGASTLSTSRSGFTPMMAAAARNHPETALLLARGGGDPAQASRVGSTATELLTTWHTNDEEAVARISVAASMPRTIGSSRAPTPQERRDLRAAEETRGQIVPRMVPSEAPAEQSDGNSEARTPSKEGGQEDGTTEAASTPGGAAGGGAGDEGRAQLTALLRSPELAASISPQQKQQDNDILAALLERSKQPVEYAPLQSVVTRSTLAGGGSASSSSSSLSGSATTARPFGQQEPRPVEVPVNAATAALDAQFEELLKTDSPSTTITPRDLLGLTPTAPSRSPPSSSSSSIATTAATGTSSGVARTLKLDSPPTAAASSSSSSSSAVSTAGGGGRGVVASVLAAREKPISPVQMSKEEKEAKMAALRGLAPK